MGNVVSNAKAKNVEISVPSEPPKAPEEGETLKYQPSEALLSLWENIAPGTLNQNIALYIYKPYSLITIEDKDSFEGYEDIELVDGQKAYQVLVIWDGTDGNIKVCELVTGENAGKLVALSYGALKAYIGKTMKDLIETAEKFTWEDEEEDMMTLFTETFGKF
ncbi:hypothetical protein H8356DRAFT_1703265 [Neocallimastix lanati (nom. inval.)]|jgi:hypothetical protein|uniref:Uncharacterized protein n=1 Tax=Neocallimastix californiae TaxID=1754190 RepID=A0A1Y2CH07_9FUNG|nr:hypothetical protein H8356DRAFT_1703265 [Neocallimastix sp. JGI-2020a]ORY46197.1 hypothetical protein LY90DRAFT_703454 [Neocallimastix californiae]|eukprot:ORY46197.1 hypothetical protein LY90DRAFT_703454 [Neocallimastix californiae]